MHYINFIVLFLGYISVLNDYKDETDEAIQTVGTYMRLQNRAGRIMYGTEADTGDFPHQVALFRGSRYICGASLISNMDVLTAGHCVDRYEAYPTFFSIAAGRLDHNEGGITREVAKIYKHEQYNINGLTDNDVAVLNLQEMIEFTDEIQPVEIDMDAVNDHTGETAYISGWGFTEEGKVSDDLIEAELLIVSQEECMHIWPGRIRPGVLCASDANMANHKQDVCSGDSGGPLVQKKGAKHIQIGIVSWGAVPCIDNTHKPSAFARVAYYRNWIRRHQKQVL